MIRYPLLIAVFSLSILCAYLAYAAIDQSVSLDHARAAQATIRSERSILRELVLDMSKGVRREDIGTLLQMKYAKTHVVKGEAKDTVSVDTVILRFSDEKLNDVLFMNDEKLQ